MARRPDDLADNAPRRDGQAVDGAEVMHQKDDGARAAFGEATAVGPPVMDKGEMERSDGAAVGQTPGTVQGQGLQADGKGLNGSAQGQGYLRFAGPGILPRPTKGFGRPPGRDYPAASFRGAGAFPLQEPTDTDKQVTL